MMSAVSCSSRETGLMHRLSALPSWAQTGKELKVLRKVLRDSQGINDPTTCLGKRRKAENLQISINQGDESTP
jgi:hypothetical protein